MNTQPPPPPPGWYPDPSGARVHRWWDGQQWTGHAQPMAGPGGSPESALELSVDRPQDPSRVQQQVQRAGGPAVAGGGGGTLFTEPVLVVNQQAKLIEMNNEYRVFDQQGQQIGSVAQIGQSGLRKALRFVSNVDQYLTHRLEVRDHQGNPLLHLTRPAKVFKSRVKVERPDGSPVGEIVQENVFGKIRFALTAQEQTVGAMHAENWRAWDFAITDAREAEVARITKSWEGVAKAMFTTADNYVVRIHYRLPDPLASLVVASAVTVDTALKQDEN